MSHDIEILPWSEIARQTGLSRTHVKRLYYRAMTKLRSACSRAGCTPAQARRAFEVEPGAEEALLALILQDAVAKRLVDAEDDDAYERRPL